MSDLLKQMGHRARARDADARRMEESREDGPRLTDPARILAALDAQRAGERDARDGAEQKTRARRGFAATFVVALAAAAAVALAVRVAPRGSAGDGAPLDYVVSVNGRVEGMRSAQSPPVATLEARDDSMQEVLLRPREAVGAKIAARVLVVRDGARVPTDLAPEVSDLGAVRFDVPGPLLRGATALVVVLASPEARGASEIRIPVEPGAEKK